MTWGISLGNFDKFQGLNELQSLITQIQQAKPVIEWIIHLYDEIPGSDGERTWTKIETKKRVTKKYEFNAFTDETLNLTQIMGLDEYDSFLSFIIHVFIMKFPIAHSRVLWGIVSFLIGDSFPFNRIFSL